jgi:toxin ParE1/3/4
MPQRMEIMFAESAIRDLEEVQEWYNNQQVPEVGERLVREMVTKVERLARFPESGRIVPEFEIANLREIIFSPFRIVYRLDRGRVRIVRIWRSERVMEIP